MLSHINYAMILYTKKQRCVYTHIYAQTALMYLCIHIIHTYIYERFDKSLYVAVGIWVPWIVSWTLINLPGLWGAMCDVFLRFSQRSTTNSWAWLCISFYLLQLLFQIDSGLCYELECHFYLCFMIGSCLVRLFWDWLWLAVSIWAVFTFQIKTHPDADAHWNLWNG